MNSPPIDFIKTMRRDLEGLPGHPEWLRVLTPSQCREWQMPHNFKLVGDYHITRGGVTVIGGPPGIGKSRAALNLALCGTDGSDWLGLPVHQRFKTFVLQNENGPHRLKADFSHLNNVKGLDDSIRITPPPEYGLRFDEPDFRHAFSQELEEFRPELVVLDPWTNVTRDCTQGDYSDALNHIKSCMPKGDMAPAIVIVAHTRKPRTGSEKPSGVSLLNELMGSTKLGSMARSAFVMQSASDETTDNRVIWTCCKNNDGEKGPRSAWERENGNFIHCHGFDWEGYDKGQKQKTVTKKLMEDLMKNGRMVSRSYLVDEIMEKAGCGKSTAYAATTSDGKFSANLRESDGLLSWVK